MAVEAEAHAMGFFRDAIGVFVEGSKR